ncbi:MAG: TIGR02281 family clan AA aspartic protease [Burkholderiales bacterium]
MAPSIRQTLVNAALGLFINAACAQGAGTNVSLSGVMGDKALLVVNGAPKTLAVGGTHAGVKLLSVSTQDAVVEVNGKRLQLNLGGTHVNLGGGGSEGSGSRIVLTAGSGGHFVTQGSINGRSVRFLVDTGATSVAMSQAEAERIGLKYKDSPVGVASTANGQVSMYRVKLDSVRINDVQVFNVDAAVLVVPMDMVLLGNSFLTRFQMKRENNLLTLDKKS